MEKASPIKRISKTRRYEILLGKKFVGVGIGIAIIIAAVFFYVSGIDKEPSQLSVQQNTTQPVPSNQTQQAPILHHYQVKVDESINVGDRAG